MKKQLLVITCILFLHISCTKRYCYRCNTDKTIISPLGRVTQSNEPSKLICDKTEDEKKSYEKSYSFERTLEDGTRIEFRTRCSRD